MKRDRGEILLMVLHSYQTQPMLLNNTSNETLYLCPVKMKEKQERGNVDLRKI